MAGGRLVGLKRGALGRRVNFREVREEGVGRKEESCVDGLLPQSPLSEGGGSKETVEEVCCGLWMGVAVWAGVGAGFPNATELRQQLAASRTQLEKCAPPISGRRVSDL